MSNDSEIIGIVLIARHGDRQGRYQNPETYAATSTVITPLGEKQEYMLGEYLRNVYLNPDSSSYIQGFFGNPPIFNESEVVVRADAGGDGGVIVDSSEAVVQGLWPATPAQSIVLANGTNVTSPLGGYQYVPIESVDPNEDVSLEGYTDCNTLTTRTTNFYNSSIFLNKAQEVQPFLSELPPYVGGRQVSLENMWNIFDFINVQNTHNATFAEELPPTFLEQARALANWHEYNVFTDPTSDGIGNIGIRTMLPSLLTAMQDITNSSNPLKIYYSAIAYIPFMSFFNMTGLVANGYIEGGIVNYAAAMVLEIRQSSSASEPVIRFQFKNGTEDVLHNYPLQFPGWDGSDDVPVSTFISAFEPVAVNTTLSWCNICGQTELRECNELLAAAPTPLHQRITPVGAGFLGAGLTAAVMLAGLAALLLLGILSLGRGMGHRRRSPMHGDVELSSDAGSLRRKR